ENVHIVINAPRNVEVPAIRGERKTDVGVRHLQNLLARGTITTDVIYEHVLVRGRRDPRAAFVVERVVAARQDEKGLAVGTRDGGDRLARYVPGESWQTGIQARETGARSR